MFKMMKSQDAVLGIKSVIFYNLLQGLLPFVNDTIVLTIAISSGSQHSVFYTEAVVAISCK